MSEKRFDKLDEAIEKLDSRLDKIDITLAVNTGSLVEHVKRTNALEERLEPVEKHVFLVNTFLMVGLKAAIWIAGLAGFVVTIFEIVSYFRR